MATTNLAKRCRDAHPNGFSEESPQPLPPIRCLPDYIHVPAEIMGGLFLANSAFSRPLIEPDPEPPRAA